MKRSLMSGSGPYNYHTNIFCWGNTANGELGLGGIEENQVTTPRQLNNFPYANIVRDCCIGKNHSVLLLKDGGVYTCGSNDWGQLGHLKTHRKFEQVVSLESHYLKYIATKGDHTLALNAAGQVFAWGSNQYGQLGQVSEENHLPTPKMIKALAHYHVIQIVGGGSHSLVLTNDGKVFSWGHNNFGQLGLLTGDVKVTVPTEIEFFVGIPIAQIAAGGNHSFALTCSGMLYGWGRNTFGQLGCSSENQLQPHALLSLQSQQIKYVCCGEDHTAALTKDGGVFTFGAGMYGQLGHGTRSNEVLPRQIVELMGNHVSQIACGRCHTLAYEPLRGRIYAFGLGGNGQLGTGKTASCMTPTLVNGPWSNSFLELNMNKCDTNDYGLDSITKDKRYKHSKDITKSAFYVYKIICGGDQSIVVTTDISYPISPLDFRIPPVDSQILRIQPHLIRKIEEIKEGPFPQDLLADLEVIFSSPQSINCSFLLPDDKHYMCDKDNHGIVLSEVFNGFNVIEEAQSKTIHQLITWSLEEQLFPLLKNLSKNREASRLFIILPFCHLFHHPETHFKSLIIPFASAFLNLNAKEICLIKMWRRKFTQSQFKNLIQIYRRGLLYILTQEGHKITSKNLMIKICLDFLRLLSEENHNDNHFISYEEFYIPELTDYVKVEDDYRDWINANNGFVKGRGLFYCDYPFVFDTKAKTLILKEDSKCQMRNAVSLSQSNFLMDPRASSIYELIPFLVLEISRENLVREALAQLANKSTIQLKKPLKISFRGEDAVDIGGVTKEFFLLLLTEILDPKYGMFKEYKETRTIWFHPESFEDDSMFYLVGMVCGLAIYNYIIIYLPFPMVLYKKLLNKKTSLEDLNELTPGTVKGLRDMLNHEGDDFEQIFLLDFQITYEFCGEVRNYELKEKGSSIAVNKENREEYVELYVDFILNKSVKKPWEAFNQGFNRVCGTKVMDLFHPQELMALVIGKEEYDWKLFEKKTIYKGVYYENHLTIRLFWKVFHKLSHEDKKKFLLFLTGSDRIPLSGMEQIYIQSMKTPEDFLPVAHTCFNILDLPEYSSEEVLREKLLTVIQYTQGFGLV